MLSSWRRQIRLTDGPLAMRVLVWVTYEAGKKEVRVSLVCQVWSAVSLAVKCGNLTWDD
jgi:hypothetical protein